MQTATHAQSNTCSVTALAEKIFRLRRDRSLTMAELAHRSGISVDTMRRLERGSNAPQPGTLRAVIQALDEFYPLAQQDLADLSNLTGAIPGALRSTRSPPQRHTPSHARPPRMPEGVDRESGERLVTWLERLLARASAQEVELALSVLTEYYERRMDIPDLADALTVHHPPEQTSPGIIEERSTIYGRRTAPPTKPSARRAKGA